MLNNIIADNIDRIRSVCDEHHVGRLYVFGSVCTDQFNATSDIDLLVSFKAMDFGDYTDNYFETAELLEQIFQRRVDLVTENSLGNPYFIQSINKTKTLIYGQ
ncbi:MAG: nucleotidyltransferase domain-containing protein [Planctomycetaceae bacterium]|jgi:predicted nucleotidyltransferase|nr:nucleotidyltransferase domain-containing protein [Planctomycetaceae bacterium]